MKLSSSTLWLLRWALLLMAAILIILGVFTIPVNATTGGGLTLLGSLVACLMVWILRKGSRQSKTNKWWVINLIAFFIAIGGISLVLVGGVSTLNVSPENDETPVPQPPISVTESLKATPTEGSGLPAMTESAAPTTSSSSPTVETETITATYVGPTVEVYLTETIINFSTRYIPNPPASILEPSEPAPTGANSPSEDSFNAPSQQADEVLTEEPSISQ